MIVHRLVVHSAPGDGGSQLTEVEMLLGSLGWVHCRVMLLHDPMVAVTFAENGIGSDPIQEKSLSISIIIIILYIMFCRFSSTNINIVKWSNQEINMIFNFTYLSTPS